MASKISDEDIPEFIYEKPAKKEKALEKKICEQAMLIGWEVYKLICENRVGVPDRMFIRKGRVVFMEIKKLGEKPRLKQLEQLQILRSQSMEVYTIDDLKKAIKILR